MSRETPVQATLKEVARWDLNGHDAGPAGAVAAGGTHNIAAVSWEAKLKHDYLIRADIVGNINTNAGHACRFGLIIGSTTLAKHELSMHAGGWDGFLPAPVQLVTIYESDADSNVTLVLQFWTEAAWTDWLLNDGVHSLVVLDLGTK